MRHDVRAAAGIFALSLFLSACFIPVARAQTVSQAELEVASGVYVDWLYESNVLDEIGSKYPDLAPRIDAARAEFKTQFGAAVASISTELSNREPEVAAKAPEMARDLTQKDHSVSDRPSAEAKLKRFEEFAEGKAGTSQFQATLLFWRYRENPIGEMSDGFIASFGPATRPTSAMRVAIKYPMSWKITESSPELPEVVISNDGNGVASLGFTLLGGHRGALTTDEIEQAFPGARDIRISDGEIAGYPASTATANVEDTRNGMQFADRIRVDSIHAGSSWLYMTSSITLPRVQSGEIDASWAHYAPVFDEMRRSIKVTPPE